MTCGIHWQNKVQIQRVCWFTHTIGDLFFYKAYKILNIDKIIQELLEMLLELDLHA